MLFIYFFFQTGTELEKGTFIKVRFTFYIKPLHKFNGIVERSHSIKNLNAEESQSR